MSDLRDWVAARAAHDLLCFRLQRLVMPASPSVGAEVSVPMPQGVYWELLACKLRLVTSAAVANRGVTLRAVDQDGNIAYAASAGSNIPATTTQTVMFAGTGATINLASILNSLLPVPPLVLLPGWSIVTSTANIDAGDQYNSITVFVREWSPSQVGQHLEKILGDALFSTYADREV